MYGMQQALTVCLGKFTTPHPPSPLYTQTLATRNTTNHALSPIQYRQNQLIVVWARIITQEPSRIIYIQTAEAF